MQATSHQKQIDEGVIRSLNSAGIRARYHRMSLADSKHKDAARILEWVQGPSASEPRKGFTFIGGNDMEDLAVLVARGLHVTGRACWVLPLMRFCEYMLEDRSYLVDRMAKVSTLLVTQAGPSKQDDEVFSRREVRQIETLLGEWLADGNRLLLHAKMPLNTGWFAEEFLQRVAAGNEVIGGWK